MSTFEFDEDVSRKIEAIYLTPEVVAQRAEVLKQLELGPGDNVLDIGSGPGLLALEMAAAVGPSGSVFGIDASDPMIAMASKRCAAQSWVRFEKADAGRLPCGDATLDAAVSTQVYEFIEDVPAALAELHRVLRPGGRAVIVDTDYGSLVIHTEQPARMARILAAWDEHFVHPHLPRILSSELRQAGFELRHRASIPMFNAEFEDHTYGKGMLEVIAGFAPGRKGVSRMEADEWLAEFAELGDEGKFFFSLNRYLFVAEKL